MEASSGRIQAENVGRVTETVINQREQSQREQGDRNSSVREQRQREQRRCHTCSL